MKTRYVRNVRFLIKGLLGYMAYVSVLPTWLSPLLNKIRGVHIENIFRTYIAPNVLIDSLYPELVTIEEEVYLTRGVKIISHFNPTRPIAKILGRETIQGRVRLKKGSFLGVNAIILPDVTIGECAVVAAGAVVTRDVPDYAVVAGNPAGIIGDIRKSNMSLFIPSSSNRGHSRSPAN